MKKIIVLLILICPFRLSFGQMLAPQNEHVYTYRNSKGLFGLCTRQKEPVTPAKYSRLKQCKSFVLCSDDAGIVWDVFNERGQFIVASKSIIVLSDTSFLTFDFSGYFHDVLSYNGKRIQRLKKDAFYEATSEYMFSGNLISSEEFKDYVKNPEYRQATLCFRSGRKIDYPFKIIGSHTRRGIFFVSAQGKTGVYDFNRDQFIVPVAWDNIKSFSGFLFLCSMPGNCQLIRMDGRRFETGGNDICGARHLDATGNFVRVFLKDKQQVYNLKGQMFPDTHKPSSADNLMIVEEKRNVAQWNTRNRSYLVNSNGESVLDKDINTDSIVKDLGSGLFGIYKEQAIKDERGNIRMGNEYISSIYDSRSDRIIITADTASLRIYKPYNYKASAYIVTTRTLIIYIGADRDTQLVLRKQYPDFDKVPPAFDQYGILHMGKDNCVYYNKDKTSIRFEYYKPYKGLNDSLFAFTYRVDGKWGMFTTKGLDKKQNAVRPASDQAVNVAPPVYDSILAKEVSGYRGHFMVLYRNGQATWIDNNLNHWKNVSPDLYATKAVLFSNRKVFKKVNADKSEDYLELRTQSGEKITAIALEPGAQKVEVVNDTTVVYFHKGSVVLLDIKNNKRTKARWPPKFTKDYIRLNGKVISVAGFTEGHRIHLPSINPVGDGHQGSDIHLTEGQEKTHFIAKPGKGIEPHEYELFFEDCMMLYKDRKFIGLIDDKGVIYD